MNKVSLENSFVLAMDHLTHKNSTHPSSFSVGYISFQPQNKTSLNDSVAVWVEIMRTFQKIIYNIADYRLGNDSRRGQIAEDIRSNHHLIIDKIDSSHFAVFFSTEQAQMSLLSSGSPVDLMITLLRQIKAMDNGLDLLYLYNQRVFNSVKYFFTLLDHHFTAFELSGEKGIHSIHFSVQEISEARQKFRWHISDFEESPLTLRGNLVGINHLEQNILIQTNVDLKTFYIVDPSFEKAQLLTNRYYRIHGRKNIYRLSTGRQILKYHINRLSDLHILDTK